jgi:N-sulfoglucosamine sulfohydrolase
VETRSDDVGKDKYKQARPNIVMVITHDTGQNIGCYEGCSVSTPNLSRLAAEGIVFNNYFCTAPQCSPSRGSIITGRYPHQHGIMGLTHRGWELNQEEKTLGMYFQDSGYRTYLFGLQHESSDATRLGYETVCNTAVKAEDVSHLVADFIHQEGKDISCGLQKEPFFAMVGFWETHRPFNRPGYEYIDPEGIELPPYLPDTPGIRQDVARFYGQVKAVDAAIGVIRQAIQDARLDENTVFIFTTDHGPAFPRAKGTLYDPGTKTALVMRCPEGIQTGVICDELLSNVDLLPTLLEITGSKVPEEVVGRSFAALLCGEECKPRTHVFTELTWHDRYNPMRAIRTERYKYIQNFEERMPLVYVPRDILKELAGEQVIADYYGAVRPAEELYDLSSDPNEMQNIADNPQYADVKQKLKDELRKWMSETNDPLLNGRVEGRTKDEPGDCWEVLNIYMET